MSKFNCKLESRGKMSGAGKMVCVSGASGFIASWLVRLLLQRGYTVKAAVGDSRNAKDGSFCKPLSINRHDTKKVEHLCSLPGAKERFHWFPANHLMEGSFDAVVKECEGVFHTNSPYYHDVEDPKDLQATLTCLLVGSMFKMLPWRLRFHRLNGDIAKLRMSIIIQRLVLKRALP